MKRRTLIKQAGILSLAGLSMSALMSCDEKVKVAKESGEASKEISSGGNTPAFNRSKMSIKDAEKPTEFELKHTPDIVLGEKDDNSFTRIDIIVGSKNIIHPTEVNHWIDYAKLYADDQLIGVMNFESGQAGGFTVFKVKLDGVKALKAEIGCNLHGIWENTTEVNK